MAWHHDGQGAGGVLVPRVDLLAAVTAAALTLGGTPAPSTMIAMNDLQVIGSHNSFKSRIPSAIMAIIRKTNPEIADGLDYYHIPLRQQLDLGVRQIELDIFADPEGGRYANPKGEEWARKAGEHTDFDREAMLRPGFKVFHIPDIDYLSNCATLVRCLTEIDRWSRAHPDHLPIMITINAADTPWNRPGITDPLPLDRELLDALDAEIRSVLPSDRLIIPDDVRGAAKTLRASARNHGWPSLQKARGRIYILLDVRGAVSENYRAGHPSLAGRAMFGSYPDDEPESAIQIVQNPLIDGGKITHWVRQGLVVRTRSDADTIEARSQDHRKAEAAMASGAQAISTDYYPGAPDPMKLGFKVALSGGSMAGCSRVRVPAGCALLP